jgi:hypothetical protein
MADKVSPLEFPPVLKTRHRSLFLFLAPALDAKVVVFDRLVLVLEIDRLPQVVAILISRFLQAFFGIGARKTEGKSNAKRCKGNETFHGTSFRVVNP